MNKNNYVGYERISKITAKKRYEQGLVSYIVPCKANLNSRWFEYPLEVPTYIPPENGLSKEDWDEHTMQKNNFENFVNEFIYYNCQYNQMGKYPAFYKREEYEV